MEHGIILLMKIINNLSNGLLMPQFKVYQELFNGDKNFWFQNYERNVQQYLNDGWKLVTCQKDKQALYAFFQKE